VCRKTKPNQTKIFFPKAELSGKAFHTFVNMNSNV
jgi:hypothetical protein